MLPAISALAPWTGKPPVIMQGEDFVITLGPSVTKVEGRFTLACKGHSTTLVAGFALPPNAVDVKGGIGKKILPLKRREGVESWVGWTLSLPTHGSVTLTTTYSVPTAQDLFGHRGVEVALVPSRPWGTVVAKARVLIRFAEGIAPTELRTLDLISIDAPCVAVTSGGFTPAAGGIQWAYAPFLPGDTGPAVVRLVTTGRHLAPFLQGRYWEEQRDHDRSAALFRAYFQDPAPPGPGYPHYVTRGMVQEAIRAMTASSSKELPLVFFQNEVRRQGAGGSAGPGSSTSAASADNLWLRDIAWYHLAVALESASQFSPALDAYKMIAQPNEVELDDYIAVLIQQGRWTAAQTLARAEMTKFPAYWRGYEALGDTESALGQTAEGLVHYREALRRGLLWLSRYNPAEPTALMPPGTARQNFAAMCVKMAKIYIEQQHFPEAREALDQAADLDPENADVPSLRALVKP